jgi:hypothetical protein
MFTSRDEIRMALCAPASLRPLKTTSRSAASARWLRPLYPGWPAKYSPCGSRTRSPYLRPRITLAARVFIRLLLPMPVVANTPTWLGKLEPWIPTRMSSRRSPLRRKPASTSPIPLDRKP